MNGWPDWAILAVAPPDSLAMYASDESRDNTARAIVPGTGEYNALVELESGDEDRGIELAQKLAKQTRRDVYLLLLSIHASLDDRVAFVVTPRGKPKRLDDDPDDVATRLGCPLPRPPPIDESAERGRRVLVAIGVSVDAARRLIDHDHYRIVETSRGLVMFEPGGHISRNDAIALSTAFPDCTVYIVNHLAKYGGFVVMRYQRGVVTGTFDWPRREFVDDEYVPPFPELDDIEGETEPLRILAKLGVDPSLVRYPAHA